MQVVEVNKTCARCGTPFRTIQRAALYCDRPECKFGTSQCQRCEKTFIRPKYGPDGAAVKFCSKECRVAAKRKLSERDCVVCGARFRPRRDEQRACGGACRTQLTRKANRRTTCEGCGGPMPTMCLSSTRFCSKSCAGKHCHRRGPKAKLGAVRVGTCNGYSLIKVGKAHPSAMKNGWMPHHRYVAERVLGRQISADERVHHRNGDKTDNTAGPCLTLTKCECGVVPPHNLELWRSPGTKKDPKGVRHADYHCPGCRCFEKTAAE